MGGNSIGYSDRNGLVIDTPFDLLNVALGTASAVANISQGNYGASAVDALGVAIDIAAAATPGVPGGAATAIKAVRCADNIKDAESLIKAAGNLTKVKAGKQGFFKGNGDDIFNTITKGSVGVTPKGGLIMPNGSVISKYFSSTSGEFTIFINQGSNAYKIRISP